MPQNILELVKKSNAEGQDNNVLRSLKEASSPSSQAVRALAFGVDSVAKKGSKAVQWFKQQDKLDQAALASMPIPVIGDILGALADAKAFGEDPSIINGLFSAAGLLPFVPPASARRTVTEGIEKLEPGMQEVTDISDARSDKIMQQINSGELDIGSIIPHETNYTSASGIEIQPGDMFKNGDDNEPFEILNLFKDEQTGEMMMQTRSSRGIGIYPADIVDVLGPRIDGPSGVVDDVIDTMKGDEFFEELASRSEQFEIENFGRALTEDEAFRAADLVGEVEDAIGEAIGPERRDQILQAVVDGRTDEQILEEVMPRGADVIDIAQYESRRPKTEVVYHGTNKNFPEFKLEGVEKLDDGWYGHGVYFTPSAQDAEFYAELQRGSGATAKQIKEMPEVKRVSEEIRNYQDNGLPIPEELYQEYDKQYSLAAEVLEGSPNIRPVRLNFKKPLVVDRMESIETFGSSQVDLRTAMMREFDMDAGEINKLVEEFEEVSRDELGNMRGRTWQHQATEFLKDKGYDGIIVRSNPNFAADEGHEVLPVFGYENVQEIVVFDPEQARSVFKEAEVIDFPTN